MFNLEIIEEGFFPKEEVVKKSVPLLEIGQALTPLCEFLEGFSELNNVPADQVAALALGGHAINRYDSLVQSVASSLTAAGKKAAGTSTATTSINYGAFNSTPFLIVATTNEEIFL